jgi:hypothetical protein
MALTGRGYTWGNPTDPESDEWDWAQYLDRWNPSAAASVGDTLRRTLRDGGMAAFRFEGRATVDVSDDAGHAAALVTDNGTATGTELLTDGQVIEAPAGASAWLVLINASTTSAEVALTLTPPPDPSGTAETLYLFDSSDETAHTRPGTSSGDVFTPASYQMGPEDGIPGSTTNLGTALHDWDTNIDDAGLPGIVVPRGAADLAAVWHEQWSDATVLSRTGSLSLFVASPNALAGVGPGETLQLGIDVERLRANENTVDATLFTGDVAVPLSRDGWTRVEIPLDFGADVAFAANEFLRLRLSCLGSSEADCHLAYDNEIYDAHLAVTRA